MTASKRAYRSEVRDRQAGETRDAIIDAAAALLAQERVPVISVPEIAIAAGVGVATVYRHFATKDDVFEAVYDRWMASARDLLANFPEPDLDEFLGFLPELWRRQSDDQGLADAMSAFAPAGRRVRRRRRLRRRQVAVDLLADVPATAADRARLERVVLLLTSTTAHRHLRDHWAVDTETAAETVAWAIRILTDAARERSRQMK